MRYIVVFAGARDGYHVAHALAEAGVLERLVTEFYYLRVPHCFANAVVRLFPRAQTRASIGVARELVMVPFKATAGWGMHRLFPSNRIMIWVDSIIGKAAGRLAGRTGAGVLAYSYYASYAFEKAPAGCIRVIFQVHPHPLLTREILQEEMRLQPFSCSSLMAEPDLSFPPRIVGRLAREAGEADFAITPSTFAKQSLVAAGISADKITVVPYGIDSGVFRPKSFQSRTVAQPLRLIFVGSLVQRKGLSYLFEAMRRLKGEPVELVLVGRGSRDDRLLAQFADVSFRLAWNLSRHDLVRELHAADVFVFPSLVESFAHVILEAMSVGLPVITTANTAGPDLLVEGRTGFVGPIRDVGFLVGRIRWFIENRAAVATMGQACQAEAARRSWHRFRAEIRQALIRFEGQWTR